MSLKTSLLIPPLLIFVLAASTFASEVQKPDETRVDPASLTREKPAPIVGSHESLLLLISGLVSFSIALGMKRGLTKYPLDRSHTFR